MVYGVLLGIFQADVPLILAGSFKNAGREFVVTLLASLIAALLLYAIAVNVPYFYKPVVEPFAPSGWGVFRLRDYSEWWGAECHCVARLPRLPTPLLE